VRFKEPAADQVGGTAAIAFGVVVSASENDS
jgi:hypothetical protein